MKVLLCGDSGFIGRNIRAALTAAGHEVIGTRQNRPSGLAPLDFAASTQAQDWLPWLTGIDAVVNAVGVLRDTRRRPMAAIHALAPAALFEACAQAGVRRVVHVSALGIEGNPTAYAQTKLAAEQALQQLTATGRLQGAILRPSVVFGPGGASTQLFLTLARLPLVFMPAPALTAKIQPVAVADVAQAVAALLGPALTRTGIIACTGPTALTMAAFVAALRGGAGRSPAQVLRLPMPLTRLSARLGDMVPVAPWCTETLTLMQHDNVAPVDDLAALLGRAPTQVVPGAP